MSIVLHLIAASMWGGALFFSAVAGAAVITEKRDIQIGFAIGAIGLAVIAFGLQVLA